MLDMKVQIQNPKSKRWVLVDKEKGEILSYHRKPLENVPVISYLKGCCAQR